MESPYGTHDAADDRTWAAPQWGGPFRRQTLHQRSQFASGTERISEQVANWHPPKEMIARQPYLPRFSAGGEGNPLGARALYLRITEYRIHGTNQPSCNGCDQNLCKLHAFRERPHFGIDGR
jgi:hypothetical protein